MPRRPTRLCTLLAIVCMLPATAVAVDLDWSALPPLPNPDGVAGPFVGVHGDALFVAGGANFPGKPRWETAKVWHDQIWVLLKTGESDGPGFLWVDGGQLDRARAYGVAVSTSNGVVCVGGNDADNTFADAFLLRWNGTERQVERVALPPLPQPAAYACGAAIGDTVYVAGGSTEAALSSATAAFWSLDVSVPDQAVWRELPPCPGPPRAFGMLIAQHNGVDECLYLVSGRTEDAQGETQFLRDVHEFSPARHQSDTGTGWRSRSDAPRCLMAGTGIALGQSHVLVLGGADGSLFFRAEELKDDHPGFPREALVYHTITDTWTTAGTMPASPVTTTAVRWGTDTVNDPIILPTGEVRPRLRTPEVWSVRLRPGEGRFGALDFSVLGLYLAAMIAVGVFFSFRNKTTDDFFRGGQRIPWFVAGLSIFATMLSSITFMAIPAKAYATDWVYFLVNMMAIAITPAVVLFFLPFFRKLDATSAYEYLEKRFNRFARLFASASFVLFQVGRMAVVLYLSALALAVITPMTEQQSILLMGVLSILYCAMGGLEAVAWTDAAQSLVLFSGALLSLLLMLSQVDGGVSGFFTAAQAHGKLHLVNLDFSRTSFATTAVWVVVLGGLAQSLIPYSSDMAVVQRYMAVADVGKARRAIWTNAIAILPASLLFFGVGTALFVFYAQHPARLDPAFKTDAIFPLFISRELPAGLSGLVVAGVFAAAQSTISTSMNSMSTAVVTDFVRPWHRRSGERGYLWLGRGLTVLFGALGTWLALLFANADIKSLWDQFMTILGLMGGSMCGLFCLGIFTTRANGPGAIVGAIAGAAVLYFVQQNTSVHLLLYAFVGVAASFITGYAASRVLPSADKPIGGLTLYTLRAPVAPDK